MDLITGIEKENLREVFRNCGACAVGFAAAGEVSPEWMERLDNFLLKGNNAGMDYMANHRDLRRDPRLLLDGCRSVISLAFSFNQPVNRGAGSGIIASYAYGRDYHKELRSRLRPAARRELEARGAAWRICIDSAPVFERFWAVRSGIGFRADNGMIIVPGHGSRVFLAEILTTLPIEPDTPAADMDCGHCGACRRACPGGALLPDGTVDGRRCLSYLTIEHRGDWSAPEALEAMDTPCGRNTIFGCDVCLSVCPHNRDIPFSQIPAFLPSEAMMNLTRERILNISEEEFLRDFAGTPLMRAGLEGLRRNVAHRK